jgi:hypothetical protein
LYVAIITYLLPYYFLFLEQKATFTNFRVLENIDTTINVIDPQTGVRVTTAPAKYIEMTYLNAQGIPNNGDIALLILSNDGNSGYALLPVASLLPAGELPPEHQLVFDTFELIAANSTIANATITSSQPLSPFSQQAQQQEQRLQQQEMQ